MPKLMRIFSLVLIFSLVITPFNELFTLEVNADSFITLTVEKDSNLEDKITDNSVVLKWNEVAGAQSYLISYIDYTSDNIGVSKQVYANSPVLTYKIEGLVPDVIYTFTIEAKTGLDGTGDTLAVDQLKVLTGITFTYSTLPDSVVDNNGAKEGGTNPGLLLKWNIPKIWDVSSFVYLSSDKVNYRITIGTDEPGSNVGLYKINYNGVQYAVYKESIPSDIELVYSPVMISNGSISYQWRYKDPVTGNINDSAIKPGTIYYIKIFPQFSDSLGSIRYRISPLKTGYAYTPLHILISRDSNNNVICTIYRINYDSNNNTRIINFRYEVYSSPDSGFASPTLEGYEYSQYGDPNLPIEIFVPPKDRMATYYYKVVAKSDTLDILESPVVDYKIGADLGRPTIPQNVKVIKMEPVTGVVNGQTVKSVDITLEWDKPADFENSRAVLEYYVLLSSAKTDITTSEGTYYKEIIDGNQYDIKYRTIKIIPGDSSNIDLSESGVIKYKLKGLELFTDDNGIPLENPDGYPTYFKLNKIYFLKMYCKIKNTSRISDYSLPISFTTPSGEIRKPPIPGLFGLSNVGTDEIKLQWEKVEINLRDYTFETVPYAIYYEVYMNDSIIKNDEGNYIKPFVYLGGTDNPFQISFSDGIGRDDYTKYAVIKQFTGVNEVTERFGKGIKPNTTYYFIVRTKLVIQGEPEPRYSDFSQVVSVTTLRGPIIQPGESEKKPKAPADFTIDLDQNGNQKIDYHSVTFKWSPVESNVTYRLIRTSLLINSDDDITKIRTLEGNNLVEYVLPQNLPKNSVGQYVYMVGDLSPNTLYYFSLRTERQVVENGNTINLFSSWITVPVTTYMVESPETLETVTAGIYDKYTQIRIKWRTKEDFGFEVWVKSNDQYEYTKWSNVTVITEKPVELQGTNLMYYYGLISGLKSGSRYYIKVRNRVTKQINGVWIDSFSKFIGPIDTRTEFSQGEYDNDEQKKNEEVLLKDSINALRDEPFWVMVNTDSQTQIKLQALKMINLMAFDNNDRFVINIANFKASPKKVVLVPLDIIDYINKNKEVLIIKSGLGELVIKPVTISLRHPGVVSIKNKIGQPDSSIKGVYLRINLEKINADSAGIPNAMKQELVSDVIDFNIDVLGISDTDANIESLVSSKFSDILSQKLSALSNVPSNQKDTPEKLNKLISEYVDSARVDLGAYINNLINGNPGLIKEVKSVSELTNPVEFRYLFRPLGSQVQGYSGYCFREGQWVKFPTVIDMENKIAVFESIKTGKSAVFKITSGFSNLSDKLKATQLSNLDTKFDIFNVVAQNGSFKGYEPVTMGQMISLIDRILGERVDSGEAREKVAERLELPKKLKMVSDTHNLTREEAGYILIKLYCIKTGVSFEKLKPAKTVYLQDIYKINPLYYKAVLMAVDLKLLNPDKSNRILPTEVISQEEVLDMLSRVLTLAGEL